MNGLIDYIDQEILVKAIQEAPPERWVAEDEGKEGEQLQRRWDSPEGITHCPLGVVLRQCHAKMRPEEKITVDDEHIPYNTMPSDGDDFAIYFLWDAKYHQQFPGHRSPFELGGNELMTIRDDPAYDELAEFASDFITNWDDGDIEPSSLPEHYGLPGHP